MKTLMYLVKISVLLLVLKENCTAMDFNNIPQLVVKGEASIFKPSDEVQITLGVVTSSENSSLALNESNQKIHKITQNLKALGLNDEEYQTGRFHIRPIYQKFAKDAMEDRSKVVSYEVVNSIQIKTQKLALVDKIIGTSVEHGANQVDSVNFSLNNPQTHREEVIKLATQNALMDASALSNAAGVRLKRIVNLSLDNWQHMPQSLMLSKRATAFSSTPENGVPDAIDPGQTEIHAVVNVIFEIN